MFRSDPLSRLTHPTHQGPREKLSRVAMTVEIAVSACPNCCLLNGVIERLPKARHPSHRAMVSPEEGCIERLLRYEGNYMKKHMEWNEGPTVSGERVRTSLRLSRKRAWIRARSSRRTRAADSQPRAGLLFHLPLPSIAGL
jgi:hypothetical protein